MAINYGKGKNTSNYNLILTEVVTVAVNGPMLRRRRRKRRPRRVEAGLQKNRN